MTSLGRHALLNPGLLFAIANVFAFSQSESRPTLALAIGTALLVMAVSFSPAAAKFFTHFPRIIMGDPDQPALRLIGYGGLLAGLLSCGVGALLPGLAGFAFGTGNLLASSRGAQHIQRRNDVIGWRKVVTNPAVWYGVGYALIGLMAGGGWALLADPFANIPALITTFLGITATSLSAIGLALGVFTNPAAPFMTVAVGTAINAVSGLLSGNVAGLANNIFAMLGELRMAQLHFNPHAPVVIPVTPLDRFFNFMSCQLLRALEMLSRARD